MAVIIKFQDKKKKSSTFTKKFKTAASAKRAVAGLNKKTTFKAISTKKAKR